MIPETSETRCPEPSRFWEVAAGGFWAIAERLHLASCPACQAAERAIRFTTGPAVQTPEPFRATPIAASGDPATSGLDRSVDHFLKESERIHLLPQSGAYSSSNAQTGDACQTRHEIEGSGSTADQERTQEDSGTFPFGNHSIDNLARSSARLPRELGNYEIVDRIGTGGMGVVYKVRDVGLNRVAALKVIRHLDPADGSAMDRFFRAARLWARLSHPSIARIYEVNQLDGMPYIVSQFIEGETLAQMMLLHPRISDRDAAGIMARIADAAGFAHERGVIHRDIKPSNIMIDSDRNPVLIDFGLARSLPADDEASLTFDGQILGTPSYMSPEQARGSPDAIGPASDVFSLGCTLYALISGQPPFRGHNFMETFTLLLESEPSAPARLGSTVSRDLATICLKALAKEPGRRYPSAREMADDLRRFLEGESIRARPRGALYRLFRRVKRRPLPFAIGLIVFMLFSLAAYQRFELQRLEGYLHDQGEPALVKRDRLHSRLRQSVNRASDAELRLAVKLGEKGVRDQPDRLDYRRSLAGAHRRLGNLYVNTDRLPSAVVSYEQAAKLLRQCLQLEAADSTLEFELAEVLSNAGETARALGQTQHARELYREAVILLRKLVALHPETRAYRDDLARALDRLIEPDTSNSP
jgi:tetratricopeptide (TPR) repeat protein